VEVFEMSVTSFVQALSLGFCGLVVVHESGLHLQTEPVTLCEETRLCKGPMEQHKPKYYKYHKG